LFQFNFTLKYILGKSIEKANGLSRRPDWQEGVEKDNKNQMLIKPGWIKRIEILVEENDLRENQKGTERR